MLNIVRINSFSAWTFNTNRKIETMIGLNFENAAKSSDSNSFWPSPIHNHQHQLDRSLNVTIPCDLTSLSDS